MVDNNIPESSIARRSGEHLAARLSKNISARRRALSLTQAQLAERLGVDTETLSRFERGKHLPSLLTLERLAALLLTTVAELLAEEAEKVDDEVLAITSWFATLKPKDREFAKAQLKQCCDYLSTRQSES